MAEVAAVRGHTVQIIEVGENRNGAALTRERLAGVDAVIDFTTPDAVMANIEATIRAGANMVVGTTGWYAELPNVRNQVERASTGFVWASNFSIGVNLFFAIVREGAKALKYGYEAASVRPITSTSSTRPAAPPSPWPKPSSTSAAKSRPSPPSAKAKSSAPIQSSCCPPPIGLR